MRHIREKSMPYFHKKKDGAVAAGRPGSQDEAAAEGIQNAAAAYLARKRAKQGLEASQQAANKPVLNLHGSSRAALRTALRLAFASDVLTLEDLRRLLRISMAGGLGLSEGAVSSLADQVKRAYGENFTVEQLVCLVVPLRLVARYADLTDDEITSLRARFDPLAAGGTIGTDQLSKVAEQLPELHGGPLSDADHAAIVAAMQKTSDGRADLESLFNLVREQQQRTRAKATEAQLVRAFHAFDSDKSGTLPLERLRGVIKLFDGADVRAAVMKDATVALDEPKEAKTKARVDYRKLVEAQVAAKAAEEEAAAAAADKGGGWLGGMFVGGKDKEKKEERKDKKEKEKEKEEHGGGPFGGLFGGKGKEPKEKKELKEKESKGGAATAAAGVAVPSADTEKPVQMI